MNRCSRLFLVVCVILGFGYGLAYAFGESHEHGAPAITFRRNGLKIPLSDPLQRNLVSKVKSMMSTCGLNSVQHPENFKGEDSRAVWAKVRSGSHIYVRFPQAFQITSWFEEKLSVSEVLIGLQNDNSLGPELTRHGGITAIHVKCDGYKALEIMCMPELAPHLPRGYGQNCH